MNTLKVIFAIDNVVHRCIQFNSAMVVIRDLFKLIFCQQFNLCFNSIFSNMTSSVSMMACYKFPSCSFLFCHKPHQLYIELYTYSESVIILGLSYITILLFITPFVFHGNSSNNIVLRNRKTFTVPLLYKKL